MSKFKIIILALVIGMAATLARADFRIYPTIQITNNPAPSNTLSIGTNVLTWLPGITNTASQVLITNTTGGNATNLFSQLGSFSITNVTVVSLTNGTYITLVGALNSNLTVTLVGNYGRVTYYTSAVYAAQPAAMPFTKETLAQRQAIINGIMTGMNAYATSPLAVEMNMPTGTVAKAIVTGKLAILSTNVVGGTNGYLAFGQNTLSGGISNWETYVAYRLQPFSYVNPLPALTGPNGEYTNVIDGLGYNWNLTNSPGLLNLGTWWKYSFKLGSSTPANFGGVNPTNRIFASTIFENDGADNFVQFNQPVTFSNSVFLAAGGSIAFGSGGTISAGQITASVSLSGTNITGYTGNLTNKGTFYGGTIDGSAIQNGTLNNMTNIGGTLKATKSSGSFDVSSDIAYTVTNFTSLANGNNIAVDFGSNVFVRLAGSLSADGAINGIVNGRGGKTHILFNDQPYTVFLSQNTSDPVETNRFFHKWTGGDLGVPPYGWSAITYVMASQRWEVSWIYPQTSLSTNSVALLNGVATNLAAWPSASNVMSLIVYSLTNSTTNMVEWQDNTGRIWSAMGPKGGLHIGGGSQAGASNLLVEGSATINGPVVSTNLETRFNLTNLFNSSKEFARLTMGTNGVSEWFDESEEVYINESFMLSQSQYGAAVSSGGSGSSVLAGGAPPLLYSNTGWAKFSSVSNLTSLGYIRWSGSLVLGTMPLWLTNMSMNAQMVLHWAADNGSNVMLAFGTEDQTSAPLSTGNGVNWLARPWWSTNWLAWSVVGGVSFYATSSFPILTNTLFSLQMRGTTNAMNFYTNGVYCGITLSNLPGSAPQFPICKNYNQMGTNTFTGSNQVFLDKFQFRMR